MRVSRVRDALFDLCDALATDPGARSFVALSPAPCFQRRWPGVYEALEDGQIDRTALRALFQDTAPRADLARLYLRRFSIEHGYRFDKQDLLWTAPYVRTLEQMERWTDVVAAQAQRLPWEDPTRPLSPRQVRRVLARIIAQEGAPAAPPRPRGQSPGRARGAVVRRAPRHPVIRTGPSRRPPRPRTA